MGWRMREEKKKRGRKLRERSSTFSLGFSNDQTGRFWRSKKKSAFPNRELQVETENREFRKALTSRSSSTLVTFYPKRCMVDNPNKS